MRAEGLRAYAHHQAAMYWALAQNCLALWQDIPAHVTCMQAIILNPSLAKPDEFDGARSWHAHMLVHIVFFFYFLLIEIKAIFYVDKVSQK